MSHGASAVAVKNMARVVGWPEAVRIQRQIGGGEAAVGFAVNGRRYAMTNDSGVPYHVANSWPKLSKLARHVRPDDEWIVDVGAHSGLFSRLARERSASAMVMAIEADPRNEAALVENLGPLDGCSFELCAVGSGAGDADFFRNEAASQASSLIEASAAPVRGTTKRITVPVRLLDDLCDAIPRIDVLKIDVQGAEGMVLDGAVEVLKRTRTVLAEITFLDPDPGDVLARLESVFGRPTVVNPVLYGADLAFSRTDWSG